MKKRIPVGMGFEFHGKAVQAVRWLISSDFSYAFITVKGMISCF